MSFHNEYVKPAKMQRSNRIYLEFSVNLQTNIYKPPSAKEDRQHLQNPVQVK
jgi:hypothetical protein